MNIPYMDPMGFVGIQTAKNPSFLSSSWLRKINPAEKNLRRSSNWIMKAPKNRMKRRNRWNEVTLAGWSETFYPNVRHNVHPGFMNLLPLHSLVPLGLAIGMTFWGYTPELNKLRLWILDLHVRCLEAPNIFSQMAVKIGDLPWYKVKSYLKLIQVMRDYQYLPTLINSLATFQTGNASANLVSTIWDEHSLAKL